MLFRHLVSSSQTYLGQVILQKLLGRQAIQKILSSLSLESILESQKMHDVIIFSMFFTQRVPYA